MESSTKEAPARSSPRWSHFPRNFPLSPRKNVAILTPCLRSLFVASAALQSSICNVTPERTYDFILFVSPGKSTRSRAGRCAGCLGSNRSDSCKPHLITLTAEYLAECPGNTPACGSRNDYVFPAKRTSFASSATKSRWTTRAISSSNQCHRVKRYCHRIAKTLKPHSWTRTTGQRR